MWIFNATLENKDCRVWLILNSEFFVRSLTLHWALSSPGNTYIWYTRAYNAWKGTEFDFLDTERQWQCESEDAELAWSNIRSWHCTVLRMQSFWRRRLPAHAQSDPWPSLKQNVITSDMSSTLCATVSLSFLPALSCCPSPVILERHQQHFIPAEPSSLSSSAAHLPKSPCKGGSKPNMTIQYESSFFCFQKTFLNFFLLLQILMFQCN